MKTLNVYRIYFPDPPGGLQEAIKQICLSTSCHGVENDIFTLSKSPSPNIIKSVEATIYRERSWISPASCDVGGLNAFLKFRSLAMQSDIIHLYHPWPFGELLNLSIDRQKPRVLTYISDVVRQVYLNKIYQPLMIKTLDSIDIIIANCPNYIKTSPVLRDRRFEKKIRMIPLGINESSYPKIDNLDLVLKRFKFDYHTPFFLFIGVLRYYKGLHTLLEAAKKTSHRIVIAGSGPEENKLKEMAADLSLKNVLFIGSISNEEKVALLTSCHGLILPSHLRSEAYGMVLVEASMYGKPMISCEIGTGTSFVNQHLETGFVVKPQDALELANAINELAEPKTARAFGAKARDRYISMFSGDALGKAYAEAYRSLL